MNLNATLLGQMITFAIFIWFTMKFIWPPVIKAMQERQKKIAEGLDAAERGEHALKISRQESAKLLNDAKKEAAVLFDQTKLHAAQIIEEAKGKARQESQNIIAQSQEEINQNFAQAKNTLQRQVIDLAIESASKILGSTIDKTVHQKLFDELIDQIQSL